jgi:predicted nucleic acid-binding Zn ribbon protein
MTRPRRGPRGGADRGPRPVGESLDEVVAGLAPPSSRKRAPAGATARPGAAADTAPPAAATLGTVFSRWEELVGAAVARHARPLRLEGGALVVAVDQPPWATQLRVLAPGILARLTEETGERFDHLQVVVRP